MADPRQDMYDALTRLRQHIGSGRLVLFVGEQLSVLPPPARLDHWWQIQSGISGLAQLESDFMKNLPQRPAKVHNVLRTLGTFPLILTTNQDELLERLLWGRGSLGSALGEKIRLDQVGQVMKDWPELHRHLIVKMFGDTSYTARCS
ncbi:PREDICTED: uncharacterized protein LOC109481453, partial [Branchiostoma belcheri]|uniref:Uncharacterized protein LOC109481453 n=1 Tax=Branchiostoma belcheri TaxID=7741 RepID=A0A6P4ZS02_BRABE